MRVLLDQTTCDVRADSVEEAITAAAAVARKRGRLIVEILVDGRNWNDTESPSPARVGDVKEVRLTTADPKQLACQAFDEAAEALREADRFQQSAADSIQADRMPDAMESLHQAFAIWATVEQAMRMGAEAAGIDLGSALTAVGCASAIERLNTRLKAIRTSLENRDPVGLSDTLLYDMPEVIVEWRGMLAGLRRYILEPPPAGAATA